MDDDVQDDPDGFRPSPRHLVARPPWKQITPILFEYNADTLNIMKEIDQATDGDVPSGTYLKYLKLSPRDSKDEDAILSILKARELGYFRKHCQIICTIYVQMKVKMICTFI